MTNKREFLNNIKKTVLSIAPEAKVILYGSRARGDAKNDSDWDFLILTKKAVTFNTEKEFTYLLYDVELETDQNISILVKSEKVWKSPKYIITPLYKNIEKEGIIL